MDDRTPLYIPPDPESSSVFKLLNQVNAKYGLHLSSYEELYNWSIARIDDFWSTIWDETAIIGSKGSHVVDLPATPADNPPWFSEASLNWAENMLRHRSSKKVALIQATEPTPSIPDPPFRRCTYGELYSFVADLTSALLLHGLQPGDRVASYSSNCIEIVVAALATTAIGCIWVSAAADFGPDGVMDKFEQVQPSLIFAVDFVVYNAKVHDHLSKLSALSVKLARRGLPNAKFVVIPTSLQASDRTTWQNDWMSWDEFIGQGKGCRLGRTPEGEIEWRRKGFNWPLWILFSSGTTGRPKAIVHRAGGMLLQSKKELMICADLKPEDVFFYYTTTGWMMWNFLLGGLSLGMTLVLYDGSPLKDPTYLWKLIDTLGVTVFGTSAKYIDQLSKRYKPREHHQLKALKHIYSTGSPLTIPLFDFVYRHVKPGILLASITGGTDICSLFAGICTALPVYRGELQCRLLGMAVETFLTSGETSKLGEPGELVCVQPFPCEPLGFWPLPGFGDEAAADAAQARFQETYFATFKGVWYHGDHALITPSKSGNGGGLIMLGRSDGVLNPGGIRFGSAELYDVLDACFSGTSDSTSEHIITDYMAVGQAIEGGADERVILFVVLSEGKVLSAELESAIKAEIRTRRSPRHVPSLIIQVKDVPYTINGKRMEVLVKKIMNGGSPASINPATLRNPECLEEFVQIRERWRGSCGA